MVSLSWNRLELEDVDRYIVYWYLDSASFTDTVADTSYTIRLFTDPADTGAREVTFQVAALDEDMMGGGVRSPLVSLIALPPSWSSIRIAVMKLEGIGSVESVYVAAAFSSRLRKVEKIVWWIDHPESVLVERDGDERSEGIDTLLWLTRPECKFLHITFIDDRGLAWSDSIDAATMLPTRLWETVDTMVMGRRYAGCCTLEGKIYLFGGGRERYSTRGPVLSALMTAEMFDPETGTWRTVAPMNAARLRPAGAAVGGKIYAIGGGDSTVERYDPAEDKWEYVGSAMPQNTIGASATVLDGIVYVTGGLTGSQDKPEISGTVWSFNPSTNEWKTAGHMATARHLHRSVAYGSKIIIIGGLERGENGWDRALSTVECFSPEEEVSCTTPLTNLQAPRFEFGAAVVGKNLVILGGLGSIEVTDRPLATVELYDLQTGEAPAAGVSMSTGLEGAAVIAFEGRVFVAGGGTNVNGQTTSVSAAAVYYP